MTRTVQPHEILISACILAVFAAGVFGTGYWAGHRDVPELLRGIETFVGSEQALCAKAEMEGWFDQEDPIRINVECHGDASDWATIRMANEIGFNADVPVFVHGNCQTHEVVDVPNENDTVTIESGVSCENDGVEQPSGKIHFKCSDGSTAESYNVPQPEGQ